MRYFVVIALLVVGCQSPDKHDPTLAGITNIDFEPEFMSSLQCGRNNAGGTITGNRDGRRVVGSYCCTLTGCYYQIK